MKRLLLTLTAAFSLALLLGLALALPLLLKAPLEPTGGPDASAENVPVAPGVAFEGIVHIVGAGTPSYWLVGGLQFRVISSTIIITNGLPLQPGGWARVEAVKLADLQASKIELQAVPTSDLYDRIEAIDENNRVWQVGQTLVALSSNTEVTGSAPATGKLALVHGERSETGVNASKIVVVESDTDVVYQGVVNMMLPTIWRVDDVMVEIAATTVFSGPAPVLGSRVQARGAELAPRRMHADHVWTLEYGDPHVVFTGWLQRIDGPGFPSTWRVNLIDGPYLRPVFMAVYDDTLIDEFAGPAVAGAWLSGTAEYQGDGVYRAQTIVVLPRAPKHQFTERIVALPAGGSIGIWQVGEYRVQVSPGTGIVGTPRVGAMAWVSGAPDYANVIQAQLIEVIGP